MCYVDDLKDDHPREAHLSIETTDVEMDAIYKDAFCALAGAKTLRFLVISDSLWTVSYSLIFPHILFHLIGSFSAIPLDNFPAYQSTRCLLISDNTLRIKRGLSF